MAALNGSTKLMKIGIRADASDKIGSGHIMRCLTLANKLAELGGDITFLCAELSNHLHDEITKHHHSVFEIETGDLASDISQCTSLASQVSLDAMIVDHYKLDYEWENALKDKCNFLIAIDDLADRKHECDILIDQTFGRSAAEYEALTPIDCEILTGSDFAILRPEFKALREANLHNRSRQKLENILISLGGADNGSLLLDILNRLNAIELSPNTKLTLVAGPNTSHLNKIKDQIEELKFKASHVPNLTNMAEELSNSDLVIGAAGTSTWERLCLGVPSYLFIIADNQKLIGERMEKLGAAKVIKHADQLFIDELDPQSPYLIKTLSSITKTASNIIDGNGTDRVASKIMERIQ